MLLATLGSSLSMPVARDEIAARPILGIASRDLPRVESRPSLVIELPEAGLILRRQSPEALRGEQLNDLGRDRVSISFGALSSLSIV
jgi:hypothetical protein